MIRKDFFFMFGVGSSLDPSLSLYLKTGKDKGYALPSGPQQKHMNQYILGLKEQGIWDKIARLNFYKNNGSKEMALLDVKEPTLLEQTTNCVWSSSYGFQTGGNIIDTQFKYDDSGIVILPRHHVAWYQEPTDAYDAGTIYGVRNTDLKYLFRLRKNSTTQVVGNQFSSFTDSNGASVEWRGSNVHVGYDGGTTAAFRWYNHVSGTIIAANRPAVTQDPTPQYNLVVGGLNDKGVVTADYVGKFAGFQIGTYMSIAQSNWLRSNQNAFYGQIVL